MSEHPPPADRPTGPGGGGHPEIDELASYVAGDSDVAGLDVVRAHLAGCEGCAADVAALALVSTQLAHLAVPPMPADVATRLDAALMRAGSAAPVSATVLPNRATRRGAGWATGAAAAVVIALVAVVAYSTISGSRDSAKPAATAASSFGGARTGRIYNSGTNYTDAAIIQQVRAVLRTPAKAQLAPEPFAGGVKSAPAAASSDARADALAAPAASPLGTPSSSSAAASASSTAAAAGESLSAAPLSLVPPADLTALRSDTARLARCVFSVTAGLVQPTAIDFASYQGRPALAIVLPTKTPGANEVYVVGGECGAGEDAAVLYYATLPAG